MNIITVFPISRGIFKERLSYWSAHAFHPGSIVNVPFRGKTIAALVETVTSASLSKQDIKNADFVTRKIEGGAEREVVAVGALKACVSVAEYFAAPLGSVIKAIIPEAILTGLSEEKKKTPKDVHPVKERKDIVPEIVTFQTNDEDRASAYKSIIREEFARKRSILIVVPTILLAEELSKALEKGIEAYTFVFHGSLSKKQQLERWKDAIMQPHSILVIATPQFCAIPRKDIDTIILEKESSRSYFHNVYSAKKNPAKTTQQNSIRSAYFDHRAFVEYYAREIQARLILADSLLRVETLYRRETGELHDLAFPSFRIEKVPQTLVVDMADEAHKDKSKQKNEKGWNEGFAILSEELTSMIDYSQKRKEKVFLFCARRGLSPQTVCGDCGQTVQCLECNAPVVLHQTNKKNISPTSGQPIVPEETNGDEGIKPTDRYFLCHNCGKKRGALEPCTKCGGWKLVTLGIGIDTVETELNRHFPDLKVFKIDKDSVTTDKQARTIMDQFLKAQGGVLIGTELALSYFPVYSPLTLPYVAIASLDSLFSLPDFRINERIGQIILRLMGKTESHFMIQTRNATSPLIKQITSGALADFYRDEIAARKTLSYPPFSVFIKITIEAPKHVATEQMERLLTILDEWNPMIFPAFVPGSKGNSILHILISLPLDAWPDTKLKNILTTLPGDFLVKVNPESLL